MSVEYRVVVLLLYAATVAGAQPALAQGFPHKAIRIVAPGVGSGGDSVGRLISPPLSAALGQPVVVDNRGGNVVIPVEALIKSPPDGHTLLIHGSAVWLAPYLQDNVPYDPLRDLAPVTLLVNPPTLLVVHPSLPVKSVKDLVALARGRPGQLLFATYGTGNATHLAAESLKTAAGIDIVRVNYKSTGTALTDLLAGQVQFMFAPVAGVMPQIKAGRIKALAVTTSTPSALVPDLPTIASTLPAYGSVEAIQGMFAPGQTPASTINRLNQEIAKVLNRAEIRDGLMALGVEPVGNSPQAFAEKIKAETVKWGKVLRDMAAREK